MKADCDDVTDICNTLNSCLVLQALSKGVHSNMANLIAYSFVYCHSEELIHVYLHRFYPAIIRRGLKALQQSKGEDMELFFPEGDNMT